MDRRSDRNQVRCGRGTAVTFKLRHHQIFACLNAAIGGFGGTFLEAHARDEPAAAKVPRKMIGRMLTATEAGALLDRLT
jgi:hypothetical protein